jgi:alginate biosynthesis protein AlgX
MAGLERFFEALKAEGIQLIAVPLPTAPMTVPEELATADLGDLDYDLDTALRGYRDFQAWLESLGVHVVDPLKITLEPGRQERFYLQRDMHWTPEATRDVAALVAEEVRQDPAYASLPKIEFHTRHRRVIPKEMGGFMAGKVHRICETSYPDEDYQSWMTRPVKKGSQGLLDDIPPASIVLAGTSYCEPMYNFDGFISQELGLDVLAVHTTGGRLFSSLFVYLHSEEYQAARPRYIVWEFPWHTIFMHKNGPVPNPSTLHIYRQLVPAIHGSCETPVHRSSAVLQTGVVQLLEPDTEVLGDGEYYLHMKTTDLAPGKLTVRAHYQDGRVEETEFGQYDRIDTKGRYFMELDPASSVVQVELLATEQASGEVSAEFCAY